MRKEDSFSYWHWDQFGLSGRWGLGDGRPGKTRSSKREPQTQFIESTEKVLLFWRAGQGNTVWRKTTLFI